MCSNIILICIDPWKLNSFTTIQWAKKRNHACYMHVAEITYSDTVVHLVFYAYFQL